MIINFSIQNFGSVKDKQTISFEASKSTHLEEYYVMQPIPGLRLLKLGLIYGANASGKTTIVVALNFLRDLVLNPDSIKTEELNFNPFLFDEQTPIQNSILSIEFVQNNTRYYYEVEFNKRAIVKEELNYYKPNKAIVFKRTTDLVNQFTEISFGSKIKKDKVFEKTLEANTLWNNTVLGGFLKTNIVLPELKDVTDWFSNYLKPLILTKTILEMYVIDKINKTEINKITLTDILKKADFNISNIIIREKEIEKNQDLVKLLDSQLSRNKYEKSKFVTTTVVADKVKFKSTDIEFEHTISDLKYNLSFNDESQGTQRYFGFAGLLSLLIDNSIAFPIDELESSLHPDLLIHFLLTFLINAKNSQIIATTHNREFLEDKDIFRNDVIWFTEKNELSSTELYSLDDFDTKIIRNKSNILNAYKAGKFGGTPRLFDKYIDTEHEK